MICHSVICPSPKSIILKKGLARNCPDFKSPFYYFKGRKMPTLKEYFMIDRIAKFRSMLKQVGGFKAAFKQLYLTDDLKPGKFVGEDQFGNRYFEDNSQFMPRNRWVIYTEKKWLEYDGSQIPPEWHRWMHHICDKPPTIEQLSKPKWQLEHRENLSVELSEKYVPYSTTRPKIQGWTGPNRKDISV